MSKISADRLARYRTLANTHSMNMGNEAARAIYQRMEAEGAEVRNMRDARHGMFMAPFLQELSGIDVACVGVPMENSIPLRASTARGPAALREWSQWFGPRHEIWNTVPFDTFSIADYGDISFNTAALPDRVEQIERVYTAMAGAGINTLSVGGEHTMTFPIMKALGAHEPLGMIHIDAHADTGGAVIPGDSDVLSINDASPFRHAVIAGVLDPERTIQIGIRGRSAAFWDFSHQTGMRVMTATEFHDLGVEKTLAEIRRIVGNGPCYLTIDNDGIDPIDMPATGLPEPFGLSGLDVRRLIRGAHGLDVVGADFAELSPDHDPTGQSANLAAGLCWEMLCLLVEARSRRTSARRLTHWSGGAAVS